MYSVVKCSNLVKLMYFLNFLILKLKERSICYIFFEIMGYNYICKWWYCFVKRKIEYSCWGYYVFMVFMEIEFV